MKILSVMDPSFQNYGQVLGGYDVKELLATLDKVTPCRTRWTMCRNRRN